MHVETENLSLYLFVLTTWDPRPAVLYWLRNIKVRRVVTRPKGKRTRVFYGIFPEASDMSDDDKSSDDVQLKLT